MSSPPVDRLHRPLKALRLSVTDRCNLRCGYCMPESRYDWLPRPELLTFEELATLVDRFVALGTRKVRLTGGEPLLRHDLPALVAALARRPLEELALTTNGLLLDSLASPLFAAGLRRLTVSLDTLQPQRFAALTRRDQHAAVLRGLGAARSAGFTGLKLDMVVLRGLNDDELVPMLGFAAELGAELRFIEYMDVGGATRWTSEQVVPRRELLERLTQHFGEVTPLPERGSAPAERFVLPSGQALGVIASTTQPFCGACDRARLSADGQLFTCLYAQTGLDLKKPLRAGVPPEAMEELIRLGWRNRGDRGAEVRLALQSARGPLASAADLQAAPQLEMHRRGG